MAYVIVLAHRADSVVERKALAEPQHLSLSARIARIPTVLLARRYSGETAKPTSTPVHSLDRHNRLSFVVRQRAEECRSDAGFRIKAGKGRVSALSDAIYIDNAEWSRLRRSFTYDAAGIVAVLDRMSRERK